MDVQSFLLSPQAIESKSMEIIENFLAPDIWTPAQKQVVKRVIHTSGDPDYANIIRFSSAALEAGITAIRSGANIVTDVEMARSGINKKNLAKAGGQVHCFLNDPQVVEKSKQWEITRTMTALRLHHEEIWGNIVAIGNAPTALLEVLRLCKEYQKAPALIVGCPVGFVGAAESKELLAAQSHVPFITVNGNKGGSSIAAAIVNALVYLSVDREF